MSDALSEIECALERAGLSELALTIGAAAAVAGARVVLRHSSRGEAMADVEVKALVGNTLITAADRQSSAVTTQVIRSFFPEHVIVDEETGTSGHGPSIWYVDPLDGTTNFTRGIRSVAVGVALYENGSPVVAAICQPYTRVLIASLVGKGAFRIDLSSSLDVAGDPVQLRVSSKHELHRSIGMIDGSFNSLAANHKTELIRRLSMLSRGRIGLRSYGSNIDHQLLVGTGVADFAVADTLSGFFDVAAGALIVTEAGGRATDLEGRSLLPGSPVAIFSNYEVHEEVMSAAREAYSGFAGFLA